MDIRTKTGGAYIPPAKLRMMQQSISDKNCEAYQRLAWEALKKNINGLINKANVTNIAVIVRELFNINLIRGRGLLCRYIQKAQAVSPTFTHVYAALVAVCNSKVFPLLAFPHPLIILLFQFPKIGELLLQRLIIQFRRTFQRNDRSTCINTCRFIAHLVNQSVAHEVLALEIIYLLLENVTNDSVEVAIAFLKECGAKLEDVSRKGLAGIFERLRNILHECDLSKRVQYMIEVMFAIRKDKFKEHPAVLAELDLIEESDQYIHLITLDDECNAEDKLNVFLLDPNFQENEEKYEAIKKGILENDSGDEGSGSGSESDDEGSDSEDEEGDDETKAEGGDTIIDNTETNLILLRKTIYLIIQSSLDFEECAHKLLKLELQPNQISELCNMIVDCCAQQRTYIKFFGLLAQRFCMLNPDYIEPFKDIFKNCYDTIHRFETCKLRNVAKLFAHLLYTDAIPWEVLADIHLNEFDTTSSSRVFIKILFQQLAESMGLVKLNGRIKDATLEEAFKGLFPRDDPQHTRFAINFFTSIGLGGLTDDLREHLKTVASQKLPLLQAGNLPPVKKEEPSSSSDSDSSSSSDSSDSDSSDSSDDESSSSSDSSEDRKRKRKSQKEKHSSSSKRRRMEEDGDKHRSHRSAKHGSHRPDKRHSRHKHRPPSVEVKSEPQSSNEDEPHTSRQSRKHTSDKSDNRNSENSRHRRDERTKRSESIESRRLKDRNREESRRKRPSPKGEKKEKKGSESSRKDESHRHHHRSHRSGSVERHRRRH